jgi:hypothetical protein
LKQKLVLQLFGDFLFVVLKITQLGDRR